MLRYSIYFILTLLCFASLSSNPGKPNVILFLVDDLGYGDLSYTGNEFIETKHIDTLAKNSAIFNRGYAPAPGCSPSRASIVTGKYPARVKITGWIPSPNVKKSDRFMDMKVGDQLNHLPLEEYTIAEAFKDNGYKTVHLGKWHIGEDEFGPLAQGFDEVPGYWPWEAPKKWFSPYEIKTLEDGPKGEYLTERLTQEAVKYIRKNKDESFFMNFWHYGVHLPLAAPKDLVEKYKKLGAPEKGKNSAVFQAMKETIDTSIGDIVSALKEEGIYDNTIIMFSSDNGGVSYISDNGPLRGGKKTLLEGGIRVPTFIYWPGLTDTPKSINTVVSAMDFYPTLVDALDLKIPDSVQFDGVSLLPLFKHGDFGFNRKDLFFHWPHAYLLGPQSVIMSGDYKLIEFQGLRRFELYNIKEDIGEKNNLANKYPEKLEVMVNKLHSWLQEVDANYATEYETGEKRILDLREPGSVFTQSSEIFHRDSFILRGGRVRETGNESNFTSYIDGANFAVKKLEEAVTGPYTVQKEMKTQVKDGGKNGFLVFGESLDNLIFAGIFMNGKKIVVMNADGQMIKSIKLSKVAKTNQIELTYNTQSKEFILDVNGEKLEFVFKKGPSQIVYEGIGTRNITSTRFIAVSQK